MKPAGFNNLVVSAGEDAIRKRRLDVSFTVDKPRLSDDEIRAVIAECLKSLDADEADTQRMVALGWLREDVSLWKSLKRYPKQVLSKCGPNADWKFRAWWPLHTTWSLIKHIYLWSKLKALKSFVVPIQQFFDQGEV